MAAINNVSIEADNKSYIKEHSWSGFKSGVKYSSYLYLGATVADLLISLAVVPIFPFTLLISNPVAWVMLGVAFVALSGVATSVAKPLFHLIKDSINQRKIEKEEGQDREKVADENEKQPEPVLNTSVEASSINKGKAKKKEEKGISNCKTLDQRSSSLLVKSMERSGFASETCEEENYSFLLDDCDLICIAYSAYGYLPSQFKNDIYFFVCKPEYISGGEYKKCEKEERKFISNGELLTDGELALELRDYKQTVKRKPKLVFTSIINLSDHYVTLVVAYDSKNKNFRAYYCNSIGNPIQSELSDFLKGNLRLEERDIRSCKVQQQKNDYDCGIYALENAKIITDMMKQGRSFDEIDEKLAGYVHADEKQEGRRMQEKRKEFAEVLMNNMLRMDDREFEQKIKYYERPV